MLLAKNIITRDVTSLFAIKMIMHPLFPRFIIFKTTKKKKKARTSCDVSTQRGIIELGNNRQLASFPLTQ